MYKKDIVKQDMPKGYIHKIWLIMQLTTVILIATMMQVSATGFAQRISIAKSNASLEEIIKDLRRQAGYDFIVSGELLDQAKSVSIKVKNLEFEKVLDQIFEYQPITYVINNNTVTLKPKKRSFFENLADRFQAIDIRGKILDENGRPLVGANVRIDVVPVFYTTGEDGNFYFRNVPENANVIVSYVGYVTDTIAIKGKTEFTIRLKQQSNFIQEVNIVSTGYQKLSRERATGSFSKPDMELFQNRVGTMDIVNRLDGLIPGLTVVPGLSAQSRNGNGAAVQKSIVRGKSSISLSTDPLYVVNGVQVADLSTFNPDDVADITVLKDAAASAIWGARAANGVIVITTKGGSNNKKIKINYNGFVNFQGKPDFNYIPLLSSRQYIQTAEEIFNPVTYPLSGQSTGFLAPHDLLLYTLNNAASSPAAIAKARAGLDSLGNLNNQSQIKDLWYRNAMTINHTVSASGGGNSYTFYSSAAYTNTKSNQLGAMNNTYRIMLNQTFSPNKILRFWLNTSVNNTISSSERPISITANFLPYQLFQDADGNNIQMNYIQGLSAATRADYQARSRINLDYSPFDDMNTGYTKGNNLSLNLTGGVNMKIWKGLSFDGTYSYQKAPGTSYSYDDNKEYSMRRELLNFTKAPTTASIPDYSGMPTTGGKYITLNNDQRNWVLRNQLIYTMDPRSGKDRISVQIGQEAQEQLGLNTSSTVRGYDPDLQTFAQLNYVTLSQGITGTVPGGRTVFSELPFTTSEHLSRFTSYYGLLNYTFNQKYILDGSVRQDHSNLFGSEQSSQKKPSYSIGGKWLITKENFMKNTTWLNSLGLRATYGVTGNSPFVGTGSQFDILRVQTNPLTGNSLTVSTTGNDKLSWESTHTFNIGVDLAVLNNRLSGNIDLYQKNTTNLLGNIVLNTLTGYASSTGNLGNLRNKGIEISLNSVNLQLRDFSWSTGFVFSYNNNKLLTYTAPTSGTLTDSYRLVTTYVIGYSSPTLFAYKFAGLDNVGDPQIELADGTITKKPGAAKASDLVYMGTTLPVYNGGLTNVFRYKGISLSANMIYSLGNVMRRDVNTFYTGRLTGATGGFTGNINPDFLNRWKKPGDEAFTNIPSYIAGSSQRNTNYYTQSDINVVSASYVKLRDITLSYNFSLEMLKFLKIESVNIFLQTGNFMVWKANKYDIDPEYQEYTNGIRSMPSSKHTYSLGLNVSF